MQQLTKNIFLAALDKNGELCYNITINLKTCIKTNKFGLKRKVAHMIRAYLIVSKEVL